MILTERRENMSETLVVNFREPDNWARSADERALDGGASLLRETFIAAGDKGNSK